MKTNQEKNINDDSKATVKKDTLILIGIVTTMLREQGLTEKEIDLNIYLTTKDDPSYKNIDDMDISELAVLKKRLISTYL
jgi:hypothetical protein